LPIPAPSVSPIVTPTSEITPEPTSVAYTPHATMNPTQVAGTQMAYYLNNVFYEQAGVSIARGTNTTPVPHEEINNLALLSYEITEVSLPVSVTWDLVVPNPETHMLEKQSVTFDKVWRLTVTGGPFVGGNNRWTVWLDDIGIGYGSEKENGLVAIIFDKTLLREGARIGVSYGGNPTYLPELLHLQIP
jgi:hypothetical protein